MNTCGSSAKRGNIQQQRDGRSSNSARSGQSDVALALHRSHPVNTRRSYLAAQLGDLSGLFHSPCGDLSIADNS